MKKAILIVSFGTTYESALKNSIEVIENTIADAFLEYDIKRAFTSGMIINSLKKREIIVDTIEDAIKKLIADGYSKTIIQPTHIIDGEEYDKMHSIAKKYKDSFISLKIGAPLLSSYIYIEKVCNFFKEKFPEKESALLLMGHGTKHCANKIYLDLDKICQKLGYKNIFIGTVEAEPSINDVINKLKLSGYKKVTITPLMFVAGDHAHNDLAGNSSVSWKSLLEAEGFEVTTIIKGLGEYSEIREMYLEHLNCTIGES